MLLASRRLQHIVHRCSKRASSSKTTALHEFCVDLKQRGLLSEAHPPQILDKQSDFLSSLPNVLYAGFDPTAQGLHVGNLLVLTALCRASLFGCRSIALVGSATALIGDPSGRITERDELMKTTVLSNTCRISEQIERILGNVKQMNATSQSEIVNNMDWWGEKTAVDFRDISANFRVGNMLRMGAIKSRLKENSGINYSEFCYQIFQSADWYHLAEKYGCYFQIGGSDQLGHIDSGYDYVRRMNSKLSAGICLPLVTDEKGHKLGKSVSGSEAIWLDQKMTSAKAFHEFFLNQSDELAERLLMFYSLRPSADLSDLVSRSKRKENVGLIQRELADELTELVHAVPGHISQLNVHRVKFPTTNKEVSSEEFSAPSGEVHCEDFWKDMQERSILRERSGFDMNRTDLGNVYLAPVGCLELDLKLNDLLSITTALRSLRFGYQPLILASTPSQADVIMKILQNADTLGNKNSMDVNVFEKLSWWSKMSCIDFVRAVRSHRIEDMLSLNSIKAQMDSGLSNADLVRLVMSALEWQRLVNEKSCKLQIRNDDQEDNIIYGLKHIPDGDGVCITAEEASDVVREQSSVLLDRSLSIERSKTSPYAFYQYFRTRHDNEAEKLLLALSLKSITELHKVFVNHRENLGKWVAQTALAEEMTSLVHGEEGLDIARRCSKAMFGGSITDWEQLDRETLITLFGASSIATLSRKTVKTMGELADGARLDSHRGSALMKSGAFRVNGNKYVDPNAEVDIDSICLSNNGLTIVKWGRRSFFLVKWVD